MHAYKRILLVNPLHQGFLGVGFEPNISLGYLSETLTSHRVCHKVFDMALGYDQTGLWREIEKFRPDLVGITMFSLGYMDTLQLIRKIKKRISVPTVVGGPHVSSLRETLMERNPEIDYGVVMEGEQTFMELISGMAPSNIKGLMYRSGYRVVYTGQRPFIRNLDAIPFPRYEQCEIKKYLKRSVGIVTSRGCPHQCIYCPVRLTSGRKMRLRSPENVFEEISFWYKRGYHTLDIWDDNFTIQRGRVFDLCDKIMDSGMHRLTLNLPNGVRADRVDLEMLKKMKASGFRKIAFGVEGGNDRVLTLLRKGEKMETIERSIRQACEVGLDVILFFLIGTPGETIEDIEDSFKLAQKYPIAGANFYNLIPFPNTELFEMVQREGWLVRSPEEYLSDASQFANEPCFFTPELSIADRQKAFRRAKQISQDVRGKWVFKKFKNLGPLAYGIRYIYNHEKLLRMIRKNRFVHKFMEIGHQLLLRERRYRL